MVPYIDAVKSAFTTSTTSFSMELMQTYLKTAVGVVIAVALLPNFLFLFLFIFRYLRLIVHMISFWLYKPTPILANPTYGPKDCTVIIPTIDPENKDFVECLTSVLANNPGEVLIITVGEEKLRRTREIVAPYNANICVTATKVANKRRQICHALPSVHTAISIFVDDHVFWPSSNFLPNILAPFEDPLVATVGTNKRVRREQTGFTFAAFWNFIGALYLERHNFELAATNNIDGGVFVISGRTSAHRTVILQDPEFITGFTNERFFFGKFGPLNADDDNFITRWCVKRGWKIRFQCSDEAMIETTLGEYPKFLSQCMRWVRTTWRSNSSSLFTDRTVWLSQPWCLYAVYWTSFFNFALFYDAALIYTITQTTFGDSIALKYLALWIFASKLVKPFPHFWRRPQDLIFLPGYILFGYYHSLLKLYALLTFWNAGWGGRNLAAASDANTVDDESDNDSDGGTSTGDSDGDSSENNDSKSERDGDGVNEPDKSAPNEKSASPIKTPWGSVRSTSPPHLMQANVQELQLRLPGGWSRKARQAARTEQSGKSSAKQAEQSGKPSTKMVRFSGSEYKRTWVRGEHCNRIHNQGSGLMKERCVMAEARDVRL